MTSRIFSWPVLRVLVFFCLHAFFLPPSDSRALDLSFPQALGLMNRNNEELLSAQEETDRRQEERLAAHGLYWPKIEAMGRYTRIDEPISIDLNGIRETILKLHPAVPAAAVPPFLLDVQDRSFWRAQIAMTWPVFTGGKIISANRAAAARFHYAQEQQRQAVDRLTSDIVKRYFGLQLALQVRDVRGDVLEGMKRHAYEAGRLEEEGLIARTERLHADVALAEADRELKRAERDVEIARIALQNIVSVCDDLTPSSPLFITDIPESLAYFQERALKSHPAIGQIGAQLELAHQNLQAEKARWSPDIYLFGVRELYREDLTLLEPDWAAGIGASFTLFEGFSGLHNTRAARHLEQKTAYLQQKVQRNILTLSEKKFHEMLKAREQFDALQASQELNEENLRTKRLSFREGLSTSLDVVDAQLALSRTRVQRLQAAYDFDAALAEFLEACGMSSRFEDYRSYAEQEVRR
jgi:outer membrane protein TolC